MAGRICHHVRLGNYPEVVAAFVGIARSTFFDWLQTAARAEHADRMRTRPWVEYAGWLDNVDAWLSHLGYAPTLPTGAPNPDPRPPAPPTLTPHSLAAWVAFSDAVDRAQAEGEMRSSSLINAGAAQDWRAAAWRLERMAPRRWGIRTKLEVTGEDGAPLPALAAQHTVIWHLPHNNREPLPPGTTLEPAWTGALGVPDHLILPEPTPLSRE